MPFPWRGSTDGFSRLFFSLDDVLLRFLVFERPKGKHQHIATQEQVSDRYALESWVQYAASEVTLRVRMRGPKIGDAFDSRAARSGTDARRYLRMHAQGRPI